MDIIRQWDIARKIAAKKHAGQTDKQGVPYIEHPVRVAARLDDPKLKVVALLHDILEDTDMTAEELLKEGISRECVDMVQLLTRKEDQNYRDYILSVKAHPEIIPVKLADLQDNLRPGCPPALRKRYEEALRMLAGQ